MTSPLRIAIAGLGTVGAGMLSIIQANAALLSARCGREVRVVAVSMRDAGKKRDAKLDGIRVEKDARALATASDVDVVVETIGGSEGIAREVVEAAFFAPEDLPMPMSEALRRDLPGWLECFRPTLRHRDRAGKPTG